MPSFPSAPLANGTETLPFRMNSPTAAHKRVASLSTTNGTTGLQRNVKEVVLTDLRFATWYSSFYPEDLVGRLCERLYVCKWCFRYTPDATAFAEHSKSCEIRKSGIGTPVYVKNNITICEIDGEDEKTFTQNLSLFAKLFLDTKSVFFDVTTFIYYVLYLRDPSTGEQRVVGYFSKEKLSWDGNNLACICVFPPWQKQGFGQVLMAASYQLSKWEGQLGGPEKPLSELGKKAYVQFWSSKIARFIINRSAGNHGPKKNFTVKELSDATFILPEDIIMALREMGLLERRTVNKKPGVKATLSRSAVISWMTRNRVEVDDLVDEDAFIRPARSIEGSSHG